MGRSVVEGALTLTLTGEAGSDGGGDGLTTDVALADARHPRRAGIARGDRTIDWVDIIAPRAAVTADGPAPLLSSDGTTPVPTWEDVAATTPLTDNAVEDAGSTMVMDDAVEGIGGPAVTVGAFEGVGGTVVMDDAFEGVCVTMITDDGAVEGLAGSVVTDDRFKSVGGSAVMDDGFEVIGGSVVTDDGFEGVGGSVGTDDTLEDVRGSVAMDVALEDVGGSKVMDDAVETLGDSVVTSAAPIEPDDATSVLLSVPLVGMSRDDGSSIAGRLASWPLATAATSPRSAASSCGLDGSVTVTSDTLSALTSLSAVAPTGLAPRTDGDAPFDASPSPPFTPLVSRSAEPANSVSLLSLLQPFTLAVCAAPVPAADLTATTSGSFVEDSVERSLVSITCSIVQPQSESRDDGDDYKSK